MKHTLHGYMTIEASLIMPMVLFSLFFLIFAGFFQYDRCIAEQDSRVIVLRASEMRGKDEATIIRTVMDKGELAGEKKLLFSEGVQRELHMTNDKAKIKVSGKVNAIWNHLIKEAGMHAFSYTAEYEAKKYDPVKTIRVYRRLGNYEGN